MANLYANENFPLPTIVALRELGHDILTTQESGKAGQAIPDEMVLAFSIEQERILVTFNRKHFIHLHNISDDHSGIIVCTVDSNFEALAQRIHMTLEDNPNMSRQLIRVNRPNP